MQIKFIGTGCGVASKNRFYSSLLLTTSSEKILIDAGDGITHRLISHNIDITSISAVIITHLHSDHFAGLPALISNMKLCGRKKNLRILLDETQIPFVRNLLNQLYLYTDRLGFTLDFIPFPGSATLSLGEFSFTFPPNNHLIKYLPHYKNLSDSFASHSVLIEWNHKRILYSSDLASIPDLEPLFSKSLKYLIFEITHISHFEIKALFDRIMPEKIFLTHIPDEKDELLKTWHNSLNNYEKDSIIIAYDDLCIMF